MVPKLIFNTANTATRELCKEKFEKIRKECQECEMLNTAPSLLQTLKKEAMKKMLINPGRTLARKDRTIERSKIKKDAAEKKNNKLKNVFKKVRHIAYVERKTLTNMISIFEKKEETRREAADVVKKAVKKIIETESRPK